MTWEIALVLGLLMAAIVVFATEKLSVDIVTFLLLIVLVVTGILKPDEAFAGFSDEIIIILGSIFVISGALQETGVLDLLGHRLMKITTQSPGKLLAMVLGGTGLVSAFMNNTTTTAMLQPAVITMARRMKISASKMLMPLAFASILGGTCTLIGTSTNVAVSGYLRRRGIADIGMFEITPIGVIILGVGIVYLLTIGRRLLPDHDDANLSADYAMREYLSEIVVMPNSPLIGQSSYDSDLNVLEFRVLKVIRGEQHLAPGRQVAIEEGDMLLVEGRVETLMKVKKIEGIEIKAELDLGDIEAAKADLRIVELLITPQSDLAGRTLREVNFRRSSGLTVLAIYRSGVSLRDKIGDMILRVGDVLLVQGPEDRIRTTHRHAGFSVLDEVPELFFNPRKGLYAVLVFVAAIIASTVGLISISIAFLAAAVAMILVRCITVEKAYEYVDWRLLVLIGGMTAFGTAMDHTGAATWLADHVVNLLLPMGTMAILGGFFVLTILLTQPMSNAAAALVVLPVALKAAEKIGANPHTFGIGIMLAASISFIAPFEPSCILVYGPGKYRFSDFVKVGSGLTLLLLIVVLLLLPVFWPLTK
jgi:di/tricarboxylate transporter